MIAIFYNKNSLKDTLAITLNNNKVISEKNSDNYIIGYNDKNEVSYINIFDFSSYMDLEPGFIKLTSNLASTIKKLTNIDLFEYINCNDFKIGLVTSCEPIEGTHLHLCKVDIHSQQLQIVCGAKNVRSNLKVVVATIGSILPNGTFIKPGELLGHKSFGMLCSARELNIVNSNFNNIGIIELPNDAKIGLSFDDVFTKQSQF